MEKKIEYTDDRFDVSLTVRSARLLDDTRRSIWQSEAVAEQYPDLIKTYLAARVYPDLCAPVDESTARFIVDGVTYAWPLTCDQFINLPSLPDALFVPWYDAVYECNPAWSLTPEDKKKEPKRRNLQAARKVQRGGARARRARSVS